VARREDDSVMIDSYERSRVLGQGAGVGAATAMRTCFSDCDAVKIVDGQLEREAHDKNTREHAQELCDAVGLLPALHAG
jgi:hypothetical protein